MLSLVSAMLLLVITCLVASASACCMPDQWEGKLLFSQETYFNETSHSSTKVSF